LRKITNNTNLPRIFVEALTTDDYDRGDAKYSNSDLQQPVKAVILGRAHAHEITEDLLDRFARWRGTCVHENLERYAKANGIAEERLHAEVSGIKISTKPDHYDGDKLILDDYKTTSVWSFKMEPKGFKPDWEKQLNVGAWFLRQYGFEVKRLRIHAVLWDWNRNEARRNADYIQSPLHTVEIPLWSETVQQRYIEGCISEIEAAHMAYRFDGGLPECTPEERWCSDTVWKVYKGTNKRSTKNCATEDMAAAFIVAHKDGKQMKTVEVAGEAKRCEAYCDAYPWCDQAKASE